MAKLLEVSRSNFYYSPYAREGFEKKQIVKYNFLHNEEKKSCLKSFLTYTQTISLVKTLKQ
ncbi:MAG TPA: hypothetical protein VGZ69_03910, partial [Candidatus Rhabdochlamydia sp.]|nr:hypothetical protein [Candidatus Rhabdochlamydia sp.]